MVKGVEAGEGKEVLQLIDILMSGHELEARHASLADSKQSGGRATQTQLLQQRGEHELTATAPGDESTGASADAHTHANTPAQRPDSAWSTAALGRDGAPQAPPRRASRERKDKREGGKQGKEGGRKMPGGGAAKLMQVAHILSNVRAHML
jgi:hypothetical protein